MSRSRPSLLLPLMLLVLGASPALAQSPENPRPTNRVIFVAFTPDTRRVVVDSTFEGIRILDRHNGRELLHLPPQNAAQAQDLSSDGRWLLRNQAGTLQILALKTGRIVRGIPASRYVAYPARFSPDGHSIASSCDDGTAPPPQRPLCLFDAKTGQLSRRLRGHDTAIYGISFTPDGRRILSVDGHRLRVWEVSDGTQVADWPIEADRVWALPRGRALVIDKDDAVSVIDLASGQLLRKLEQGDDPIHGVAIAADGDRVLTGGMGTLKLWDLSKEGGPRLISGSETPSKHNLAGEVDAVALSANGLLALSGGRDPMVRLWELKSRKWVRDFPPRQKPR